MIHKTIKYFRKNLWLIKLDRLPKWKALWVKFLRIILLTIKGFTDGRLALWASGLTYYSLLSLVPMIAILIGIAKGFQLDSFVENWLRTKFSQQSEIVSKLIEFAQVSIAQVHQSLIAGLGVLILLLAVVKILRNMEKSFNDSWDISEMRPIKRQFTDYLAMILLLPIFLLVTNGVTLFLTTQVRHLESESSLLELLGPALLYGVSFVSYLLSFLAFTLLYMFIPNTKVNFTAAAVAGVATGIIYQIVQWIYIAFQVGVSQYNAIYGTFAALPLFLVWLQTSWMIILLGSKIAYAYQHVNSFEYLPETVQLSDRFRKLVALSIAHLCIKQNDQDLPALTASEITKHLQLPQTIVRKAIHRLMDAGILLEIKADNIDENTYFPAKNIDHLSIQKISILIEKYGDEHHIHLPSSKATKIIKHNLEEFDQIIEKSKPNILLKDI